MEEREIKMKSGKIKTAPTIFVLIIIAMILICALLCLGSNIGFIKNNNKDNNKDNPEKTDSTDVEKMETGFFAMDTYMSVTLYYNEKADGENADRLLNDLRNMAEYYEKLFSVNIDGSDINKLNHADGSAVTVSADTYDIIKQAYGISAETAGLFDITTYPIVKAWGFTTDSHRVPSDNELSGLLKRVGYEKIHLMDNNRISLEKGVMLDLGAIAKGYVSDKMASYLRNAQDSEMLGAVISLGGSVLTVGNNKKEAFTVGITNPADTKRLAGIVRIKEKAVVTSGGYERFFIQDNKKYHHIMDKRTGKPAESDLQSVTVISDNAAKADALATALFIMGMDRAKAYQSEHPEIELVLIGNDGSIWNSAGVDFTQDN